MEKYILIHAKCKAFEIRERVTDAQSVARLKTIRDMFTSARRVYGPTGMAGKRSQSQHCDERVGNLVVKTVVENPELPFFSLSNFAK